MTFEIETPAILNEKEDEKIIRTRIAEKEFRKNVLAKSLGISREEFDNKLEDVKKFFELRKGEVINNLKNRELNK